VWGVRACSLVLSLVALGCVDRALGIDDEGGGACNDLDEAACRASADCHVFYRTELPCFADHPWSCQAAYCSPRKRVACTAEDVPVCGGEEPELCTSGRRNAFAQGSVCAEGCVDESSCL
jgi:hypothetical protein